MKISGGNVARYAVQFDVEFTLRTSLMLRTGEEGEFADSSIEKTPDGGLSINGHVWASLFRRSMLRIREREALAMDIGKYDPDEHRAVSSFWFAPYIADEPLPDIDIRSGNAIDRAYGSAAETALFSDEIVPPGPKVQCRFTVFRSTDDSAAVQRAVAETLWVINEGIENIGGGWSYGHGRLAVVKALVRKLDLTNKTDRSRLFDPASTDGYAALAPTAVSSDKLAKPWVKLIAEAGVLDGQMLAIHTVQPPWEIGDNRELLDKYLFRQTVINASSEPEQRICVIGKSFRQAALCVPLERRWRSKLRTGEYFCDNRLELCTCPVCVAFRKEKKENEGKNSPSCTCKCRLFGSTARRGMLAVLDAEVTGADTEGLQRIALCEHSFQNINMFSGEYLKGGKFKMEILVDKMTCPDDAFTTIVTEVKALLAEMAPNGPAPPGWYRIGATSTATGQIAVTNPTEVNYV